MVEKTVTCVSSGSARVIARKLGARAKKKSRRQEEREANHGRRLDFLKARFCFLLVSWSVATSLLVLDRFASVPRALGAHAKVLWQV